MQFQMKENGFVTQVEYGELHISGDEQYGFRPYQLMVSAIAVCSGGVLRKVLEKKRLPLEDMQIRAEVKRNDQDPQEIQSIHVHFVLTGNELNEEKVRKSIEVARKNCSMVQSVEGSIDIMETFEIVPG